MDVPTLPSRPCLLKPSLFLQPLNNKSLDASTEAYGILETISAHSVTCGHPIVTSVC